MCPVCRREKLLFIDRKPLIMIDLNEQAAVRRMEENMTNKQDILRNIELFVLDMDGTFYLGDRILPGSAAFLEAVRRTGRRYLFFTNNSSRDPQDYMEKLAAMGCPITRSQIMTSGDVTIRFLQTQYPGKRVWLAGTPSLERSFREAGISLVNDDPAETVPDIVVVGFDTTLTYRKLSDACTYIRNGALFLATHPDINCPTETGFIPDCGSFCAAITLSTGVKPRYLGKPYPETVDMVLDRTGCRREKTAFVGDRLYTDTAAGVNNGAHGILVLTGESSVDDIRPGENEPDAVFSSLGEMGEELLRL